MKDKMRHAHDAVRRHVNGKFMRANRDDDPKQPLRVFHRGDLVWHLDQIAKQGECPKLMPKFGGPYLILGRYGRVDYILLKKSKGRPTTVHIDSLKEYRGTEKLPWAKSALKTHLISNQVL